MTCLLIGSDTLSKYSLLVEGFFFSIAKVWRRVLLFIEAVMFCLDLYEHGVLVHNQHMEFPPGWLPLLQTKYR